MNFYYLHVFIYSKQSKKKLHKNIINLFELGNWKLINENILMIAMKNDH
jgi:hypothetical protein